MNIKKELNILKSADKALSVLDCFNIQEENSFSELKKKTKFDSSTLTRILNTFINKEYLSKNEESGLYSLGKKILLLGLNIIKNVDFVKVAHPILKDLAKKTRETANAAILLKNEIIYVDIVEGSFALRLSAHKGDRGCIHSTALGKVIIANLDNQKSEEIIKNIDFIKKTDNTVTDRNVFVEELKKILKNGYALDNEEDEPGVKCIAAAIYNHETEVIGGISISGPVDRIDKELEENINLVLNASKVISSDLGKC